MLKRFLGIGINNYPNSPLNGCIPDIMLAYKVAKENFKFNEFKLLSDMQATGRNIRKNLEQAFKGLKNGDFLYIHYSGHGSYYPCSNLTATSETDYYDEVWVPIDFDINGPVIDNELNNLIKSVPEDVNILIISDSCFSGTMTRANPGQKWKNRFMPPPLDVILDSGELSLDEYLAPNISKKASDNRRLKSFIVDTSSLQNKAILISGCGEKQTSADVYIPEIKRYHGALTYNLFSLLAQYSWRLTYEDLIILINSVLDKAEYEQNPQLECRSDLISSYFLD